MPSIADRVKETTTTTGTGTVNLGGAATGYQAFSAAFSTGTTVYYCIAGQGTNEWEVGTGVATTGSPWTLSRATVLASSNSGSLVTFSAGTKDVFNTAPRAILDQTITAWTRAATTTLGTTLNGTLSDTSATITAFDGVAGITYHCRTLGAGSITYHASNLIITQTGASVTTAAGDTFDVEMLTATTARVKNYTLASGAAMIGGTSGVDPIMAALIF